MTRANPRVLRTTLSIATLLAVVCGLGGCRVIGPQPAIPDPTGLGSGTSDFDALDEQGVARILQTGEARFDLSTGAIRKSDVGLGADELPPSVSAPTGETISLDLVGSDGTVHAETDRVRFLASTSSPDIEQITYFLVTSDEDTLFEMLRDGVDDYGIDGDTVERWIDGADSIGAQASDYAFPPGTSLGLEVIFDVRYDPAAAAQVIIVHVFAPGSL